MVPLWLKRIATAAFNLFFQVAPKGNTPTAGSIQEPASAKSSMPVVVPFAPATVTNGPTKIKVWNKEQVLAGFPFSQKSFADALASGALLLEKELGVPAELVVAQAAHESRFGNSELALQGLNLFGITATDSWLKRGGLQIKMNTGEVIQGAEVRLVRGFRLYASWYDCLEDYGGILSSIKLYAPALEAFRAGRLEDGVKALGRYWATDPDYAPKLLRAIPVYKALL